MQQWLDRFCYKHPRLSIPGLMRYIIIGNVLVFLLDMFSTGGSALGTSLFSFSASAILHGQVWRIITFIFVPYTSRNLLLFILTLYFYYFIGTALEREWGSNKFTIFYFFGVILNILIGFVVGTASMYYVNMSMFFAFATLYPDTKFLVYFIIPIKVKWLAWLDAALFAFDIGYYLSAGTPVLALMPVVGVLNYLIFFWDDLMGLLHRGRDRAAHRVNPQTINFKKAQKDVQNRKGYLHKCAVCGITDADDPNMEFRYCSKCNGYYCYCMDHINNHVHIQ